MFKFKGGVIVFLIMLAGGCLGLLAPPPYTQRAVIAAALISGVIATAYRYTLGDKRNSKVVFAYNFLRRTCVFLGLLMVVLPGFSLIAYFKGEYTRAVVSAILAVISAILFLLFFYALRRLTDWSAKSRAAFVINYRASDSTTQKIVELLMQPHLRGDARVHAEKILTEVGALAGFASQVAVWSRAPGTLIHVESKNGELYLFGPTLNGILWEGLSPRAVTVWKIVQSAVPGPSSSAEQDMLGLVDYVSSSFGTSGFGVPRLSPEHMPHKLPRESLNENWVRMRQLLLDENRKPDHWPFDFAMAAYSLIEMHRDVLAPALAVKVVMEAAVPMSKVNPSTVPGATIGLQIG